MSNKSVTINFTDRPDDDTSVDEEGNVVTESVFFGLDENRHIAIYGEAKTTFDVADIVYLKALHPGSLVKSDIFSTDNPQVSVEIADKRVHFNIVENLSYVNSLSEDVNYVPIAKADTEWLPVADGATVSQKYKTFYVFFPLSGSLQVSYTTLGTRLRVTSTTPGDVIVGVVLNGAVYSQTITFTSSAAEEDPTVLKTYTINVTSLCAEGVIGGVYVTKDGIPLGYTDGYGQITFTAYPGSYTFVASKTGYTSVTETVTLT